MVVARAREYIIVEKKLRTSSCSKKGQLMTYNEPHSVWKMSKVNWNWFTWKCIVKWDFLSDFQTLCATELLLLIRSLWNVNIELCLVIQIQTCIWCIVRPFSSENNVQMLTYMKQWLRCRANKRHFERTWLVILCRCFLVQKLSILITYSWLFCLSIRADSGRLCRVGSSKNVDASSM